MKETLDAIKTAAKAKINDASTSRMLDDLRVEYLGKKGFLSGLSSKMGQLQQSERAEFGKKINEVKNAITASLEEKRVQKVASYK